MTVAERDLLALMRRIRSGEFFFKHAYQHERGVDPLSVAVLSGEITDAQHGVRTLASAHSHDDLSGVSADDHHLADHIARHIAGGADPFAFTHTINLDRIRFGHATGPLLDGPASGDVLALTGGFDLSAPLMLGAQAIRIGTDNFLRIGADRPYSAVAMSSGYDLRTGSVITFSGDSAGETVAALMLGQINPGGFTLSGRHTALLSGITIAGTGTMAELVAWSPTIAVSQGTASLVKSIRIPNPAVFFGGSIVDYVAIDCEAFTTPSGLKVFIRSQPECRFIGGVKFGADSAPAEKVDVTGNIAVTGTVDGVDVSSHAADAAAHHALVTLAADADTLLSLSTQEIGLDTQAANTLLAGPVSGPVADPTFRALVDADIPAAIARDAEVTSAIGTHEAAADPHTGYVKESADDHGISIPFGDGSAVIPTGVWTSWEAPYDGVFEGWTLAAEKESGALVIDIWGDSYAAWPPTVADTITGSEKPTITATGNKGQDLTLTTWTTTFSKGQQFIFNVDSATTITLARLSLRIRRTA